MSTREGAEDRRTATAHADTVRSRRSHRAGTLGAVATAGVVAALYLHFVTHYSIDAMHWDDWTLVPIIHATLHSDVTFGALWAQRNENRMLVANLVIVATTWVHGYDSKDIIVLGALFFVAGYLLLLSAFRQYVGRPLHAVHVLSLGVIWFSLEDWENALWAFQLAWYMIVFFLLLLLLLFTRPWRHRRRVMALALVVAVAGSFCSLQGLILWPVGLICLLWEQPRHRRHVAECGIWIAGGAVTTTIYFLGFNFHDTGGGGSVGFALRHPVGLAEFILAALGNVLPTSLTFSHIRAHELLGCLILLAGASVVVSAVRQRTSSPHTALAVALITFGVLFDVSVALGRLGFGIADALTPRYTMANLLVATGLVVFVWGRVGHTTATPTTVGRRARLAGFSLVALLLVVQLSVSTRYGIDNARTIRHDRIISAQAVVNLDEMPLSLSRLVVSEYVFPSLATLRPLLAEAKADHVSEFAPDPYRVYRSMGPPFHYLTPASQAMAAAIDTSPTLRSAWVLLSYLYSTRTDLQDAFPATSADRDRDLLEWAIRYGATIDADRGLLRPDLASFTALARITGAPRP